MGGLVVALLTHACVAAPVAEGAQPQAKTHRLGVLQAVPDTRRSRNMEAFRQGLREHGYVEGQNIVIDYRLAE